MRRFRCLVLIPDNVPDSTGEVFDPAGITMDTHVPVLFEFQNDLQHTLGFAEYVKGEDGRIYADVTLNEPIPDCLLARMTPCAGGTTESIESRWMRKQNGEPRVLKQVHLRNVGFSMSHNCDRRVENLGHQGILGPKWNPDEEKKVDLDRLKKLVAEAPMPKAAESLGSIVAEMVRGPDKVTKPSGLTVQDAVEVKNG